VCTVHSLSSVHDPKFLVDLDGNSDGREPCRRDGWLTRIPNLDRTSKVMSCHAMRSPCPRAITLVDRKGEIRTEERRKGWYG
jgi:hypothetical protein